MPDDTDPCLSLPHSAPSTANDRRWGGHVRLSTGATEHRERGPPAAAFTFRGALPPPDSAAGW